MSATKTTRQAIQYLILLRSHKWEWIYKGKRGCGEWTPRFSSMDSVQGIICRWCTQLMHLLSHRLRNIHHYSGWININPSVFFTSFPLLWYGHSFQSHKKYKWRTNSKHIWPVITAIDCTKTVSTTTVQTLLYTLNWSRKRKQLFPQEPTTSKRYLLVFIG